MRRLTIAMLMFLMLIPKGFSSEREEGFSSERGDSTFKIVGLNLYRSSSGSGFGSGLNMNISIEQERRHLEFGIIYQAVTHSFSGGEVIYRHYLRSPFTTVPQTASGRAAYRNLRCYFQYNFIFRQSRVPHGAGSGHITVAGSSLPRVVTFEHYAGVGVQVALLNGVYLNGGLGYGITLGSIDEKFMNQPHYAEGGRKTDRGPATKMGIGYFFNR
jgi:hypothetical protein